MNGQTNDRNSTQQSFAVPLHFSYIRILSYSHTFWTLLLYMQDDPDAHKNFLRVNRAYEVLKDEDLRKKYDMYGEDGLKEGGPTGHSYQSWSFYSQDFGMCWWTPP